MFTNFAEPFFLKIWIDINMLELSYALNIHNTTEHSKFQSEKFINY